MNFNEVIEGLYSGNEYQICAILNSGKHVCKSELQKLLVVHTGFCCQVQTGTVLEVLYDVVNREIYYQKQKTNFILPMGLPIVLDKSELPFIQEAYGENEWYDQYNVKYESYRVVIVKDMKKENSKVSSLIVADTIDDVNISYFSICNKNGIIKKYPLCIQNIPAFCLYYGRFYICKSCSEENDLVDYCDDSYGRNCEKYNGYNGWSDDLIDDVFGGIPEATWNVD